MGKSKNLGFRHTKFALLNKCQYTDVELAVEYSNL